MRLSYLTVLTILFFTATCGNAAAAPAGGPLTAAQRSTLSKYASAALRYFTSPNSNNLKAGLPHTFYSTGKRRDPVTLQELDTDRERGSHVNAEEITLRFIVLALGHKEGWLSYLSPERRYAESWGQIMRGLETLRNMQHSPFYTDGTFHRWYWTTRNGQDLPRAEIRADETMNQASDDNALAWLNLLLLEGLASDAAINPDDRAKVISLARDIRKNINLGRFFLKKAWIEGYGRSEPFQADVILHQITAGVPSLKYLSPSSLTGLEQGIWDRAGSEGSVILSAMLLSGAISIEEFYSVSRTTLIRKDVEWNSFGAPIQVAQTTYDAALFMPASRSLHGIPVTPDEHAGASFYQHSLLPIFKSHLAFASHHKLNALGSHAMSQTINGLRPYQYLPAPGALKPCTCQFPGNEENRMPDPQLKNAPGTMAASTSPHAFFVPLSRPRYLAADETAWLFKALSLYEAGFFHPGPSDDHLGWEAVIPWNPVEASSAVSWVDSTKRRNYSDEGRAYEALNSAYIVIHCFDALHPEKPLAAYSPEAARAGLIAAYLDSGVPLPAELFKAH